MNITFTLLNVIFRIYRIRSPEFILRSLDLIALYIIIILCVPIFEYFIYSQSWAKYRKYRP